MSSGERPERYHAAQIEMMRVARLLQAADDFGLKVIARIEIAVAAIKAHDVGSPLPQRLRDGIRAIFHTLCRFEYSITRLRRNAVAGGAAQNARYRRLRQSEFVGDIACGNRHGTFVSVIQHQSLR
jgi:hypothetical protein